MLVTGAVALVAGIVLAPVMAQGNTAVTVGLRIAFGASIITFVAGSYTASLQARDLRRWNRVRVSQPLLSLLGISAVWWFGLLNLDTIITVVAATMMLQLGFSYISCRKIGLIPGHTQMTLVRPLASYGVAQISAQAPAVLNSYVDQLVLSQTVPPADLGRYAVAVSLSLLPSPIVTAIGNVAFPRLAAHKDSSLDALRLQRLAVIGSGIIATSILLPIAILSYWIIPAIFGPAYSGSVPLLWVLTPGAIFLTCGAVVADLLRGRARPIIVARAQGLAAVFTVILLFALLPSCGVYAAAIASTAAYGVALAVMLYFLWTMRSDAGRRRSRKKAY